MKIGVTSKRLKLTDNNVIMVKSYKEEHSMGIERENELKK